MSSHGLSLGTNLTLSPVGRKNTTLDEGLSLQNRHGEDLGQMHNQFRTAVAGCTGCALYNCRAGSVIHNYYFDFVLIFSFTHRQAEILLGGKLVDKSPF